MTVPTETNPSDIFISEQKAFLHKTARSVAEIQANVNNLADVLVFLEVLGYDAATAHRYGFRDMQELARQVYERIDYYDTSRKNDPGEPLLIKTPSLTRRFLEGLALISPWLMLLSFIFIFGASLWLDWHLPIVSLTSLAVGVFFGLFVSEGPLWVFNRLFIFYYSQANVSEIKRILRRNYLMFAGTLIMGVSVLFAFGAISGIPSELIGIAAVGFLTIAMHRFSFVVVYALRKVVLAMISYAVALTLLIFCYYGLQPYLTDVSIRYVVSLLVAFAVLSITAAYCTRIALSPNHSSSVNGDVPHFYKPLFVNKQTLNSRFGVQVWENIPFFLYGTFFTVMLFGDRIISWIYSPIHSYGGVYFPLIFNTAYHMGADIALFVVLPIGVVQYVLVGHIFSELNNLSIELDSTETRVLDDHIRSRYRKTLAISLLVSGSLATSLIVSSSSLMNLIGGTAVSAVILQIAAIGNLVLTLFMTNSFFLMLLNDTKSLMLITMLCGSIVIVGGLFLGSLGYKNIVFAYLASCMCASVLSSMKIRALFKRPSSLFFSRFT